MPAKILLQQATHNRFSSYSAYDLLKALNESATSEGALRLWALLSQDEEQAARELLSSDEEQAAHAAQLQHAVQCVGEASAANKLQTA